MSRTSSMSQLQHNNGEIYIPGDGMLLPLSKRTSEISNKQITRIINYLSDQQRFLRNKVGDSSTPEAVRLLYILELRIIKKELILLFSLRNGVPRALEFGEGETTNSLPRNVNLEEINFDGNK